MSFLQFVKTKGDRLIFKQHFDSKLLRTVVCKISYHFQLTFHHLHAQDKIILYSYFGLFALSEKRKSLLPKYIHFKREAPVT